MILTRRTFLATASAAVAAPALAESAPAPLAAYGRMVADRLG